MAAEEFQLWKRTVKNAKATLTCDGSNGNIASSKLVDHTDFQLEEISLYFYNKTILLHS